MIWQQVMVLIVILITIQYLILWILLRKNYKNYQATAFEFPPVAILVPCRNEGKILERCLKSIDALDYPRDKIQVVLADDRSEDDTGKIIADWTSVRDNWVQVRIAEEPGKNRNGKANALMQMITQSNADRLFFTDADCSLPPTWIREMLGAYQIDFGLVTGITTVEGGGFFGGMQALDWWLTLGIIKVVSDLGYNLTAMGNNMVVAKDAYHKVGGFENISQHVTEDLALAMALFRAGYRPILKVSPGCLVKTLPEPTFMRLLQQRKRWMKGAFLLPWYWKLILGLQVAFYACMVIFVFYFPISGLLFWGAKLVFQIRFLREIAWKTETKLPILRLICFEIYNWIVSWATVIYYFWPSGIQWKNRKYR
ncbi:MAG: glycosyltransferase [Cyclobacteriaceae bacterium]